MELRGGGREEGEKGGRKRRRKERKGRREGERKKGERQKGEDHFLICLFSINPCPNNSQSFILPSQQEGTELRQIILARLSLCKKRKGKTTALCSGGPGELAKRTPRA